VLFDFDDTLVETTIYFDRAKDSFARLMKDLDLADADLLNVVNQYDIAEVEACGGFHKECFPRALGAAYREYARRRRRPVDAGVARAVEEMGREVFRHRPDPLPGARDLLRGLAGRFALVLVTRGDPRLQTRRLEASGLAGWFAGVHVLMVKDEAAYRTIALEHALSPAASWMVGNSMRADINPALRAGFRCIYVCRPHTWDYDDEEPVGGHLEARALNEVARLIDGSNGQGG
jgi:putative hydrolase of the HAD superfamily